MKIERVETSNVSKNSETLKIPAKTLFVGLSLPEQVSLAYNLLLPQPQWLQIFCFAVWIVVSDGNY
jgi:hypothetical protein